MTWYYIDPVNGTTTGDGTEDDPVRAPANLDTPLAAGDIVHFKKGTTYRGADYDIPTSGTVNQPIIYRSYGTGAKPIIDGADICKGFVLYDSDVVTDGGFENWDTDATPADWTEESSSANDVLQETSGEFMGSSCAKFSLVEDDECHVYQTFSVGDIEASKWYRIPYAVKSDVIGGKFQYKVVKDLAGTPAYWDDDTDTWGAVDTWNEIGDEATLEWSRGQVSFQSEADAATYAYTIYLGPVTDETDNWGNYWLDAVACGKVAGDSENVISNWLFNNWSSETDANQWMESNEGDGVLKRSDNERFGTYGVEMGMDADKTEVSLKKSFARGGLTTGDYRFCMHHHRFRQSTDCGGFMGVRLKRLNNLGTAYNTYDALYDTWEPTNEMTLTDEANEYNFMNFTFSVIDRAHELYVGPPFAGIGTQSEVPQQYERLWLDAVSVITDDITADCTWAYMDAEPGMVFVTGTIDSVVYDHLQLYEDDTIDTQNSAADPYPHIFGYYYDSTTGKLYVNVGMDPDDLTIECSMRDNGFTNDDGESFFQIRDLAFQHTKENGVDLGFSAAVGDRPETIVVDNCDVKYAGWCGIAAGVRPTDPDTTDEWPESGSGYTPKDITINDCDIYKWNRARQQNLICDVDGVPRDWSNGYSVPNTGIVIFPGIQDTTEDGDDIGTIYIRKNKAESDVPMINFSSERNGIRVAAGEWAYIHENEVTGVDHGIHTVGPYTHLTSDLVYGELANFEIKGNFVHDTGDDCCWAQGNVLNGSRICNNVFARTGDNCIDVNQSSLVEIFNNTFYGDTCENECIVVWVNYANPSVTGAFIFNNVFDRWGDTWYELTPGVSRGVAIGIGPGQETGDSILSNKTVKSDFNTFYQPASVTATVDYPFHITVAGSSTSTRYTFAEWQALGMDVNSVVVDPVTQDADSGDFYYKANSPVFCTGKDMTELIESIYLEFYSTTSFFGKADAPTQVLSTTSSWPDSVVWVDQPAIWNKGAWAKPTPTITKGSTEDNFPTDGSLLGAPAYLVDETNHRIWKGIITSNTASILTLDAWEPLFNADGIGPTGSLTYYIGYVFLYDKTPQYAFLSTFKNTTLQKVELHGKRVTGDVPVYAKINVNEGGAEHTNKRTLEDKGIVGFNWLGGAHIAFQFEHALLIKQDFAVRNSIYHGEWRHGSFEQ